MAIEKQYLPDVEAILSHQYDNGDELWTTPDKRLIKGAPFSTLESVLLLLELGMESSSPLMMEVADLIFSTWQKDGRFKVYPKGGIYPCHTIHAANTCRICFL